MILEILFWISIIAVFYTYLGYPLLLIILSHFFGKEPSKSDRDPLVSLLIPAFNEEKVIRQKIENSLSLNYPKDKLEIIVISDGSTDRTNEIVKRYAKDGIILHAYHPNQGKISVLNRTIPKVNGEILIFSDASSMLHKNAIKELTRNFADKTVGGVSGVYRVLDKNSSVTGNEEDFYWKYETFIKLKENTIGCTLGAHGSLYAIRKELYCFPENNTVNDDFIIPLGVVRKGYRTVYEPNAIAFEHAEEMHGFNRRVRIAVGNFQQILIIKHLLRPFKKWLLFQFISHKMLRLLVPFFLILIFVSNISLNTGIYRTFLFTQVIFYMIAFIGWLFQWVKVKIPLLKLPFYFCMINYSYLVGLFKAIRKKEKIAW